MPSETPFLMTVKAPMAIPDADVRAVRFCAALCKRPFNPDDAVSVAGAVSVSDPIITSFVEVTFLSAPVEVPAPIAPT